MDRPSNISVEVSWNKFCDSVRRSAERAGRRADEIKIILVTKTIDEERIKAAWQAGAREFGENRVQELLAKKKNLSSEFRWHLIGHLQTNKVRQILGETVLILSLDRTELAVEIDSQARKLKIPKVPCLIQVNMAGEITKSGFKLDEVENFVKDFPLDSPVEIKGLMVIGPHTDKEPEIRKVFRKTRELRDNLKKRFSSRNWEILSMGMSGDYPIAIEEGATMIRVGTAVFGDRS